MTEKISDERIDEMLAGLEGVTPGPWFVGIADGDNGTAGLAQVDNGADMWPVIAEWPEAEHIARCDPETIRALLLELRAYRDAANPLQAVVDRFPAPAPVSEITEEMVERALASWFGDDWPNMGSLARTGLFQDMRAALTAAMGGK